MSDTPQINLKVESKGGMLIAQEVDNKESKIKYNYDTLPWAPGKCLWSAEPKIV